MTFVLAALACLGHLVLMIGSHNWFYGLRHPKWLGDLVHVSHAVLVLALPVGLILGWGWALDGLLAWPACDMHALVLAYLGVCWLTALVWLPAITIYRLVKKRPAGEMRAEVVDIERQLGHRPSGDGHHAFLGHLPRNEVFQVEYVERTLYPARLPAAWDGLTILHLSDLHFHGTPDRAYFEAVLDRCAAWRPDLVCLTGDIADTATHHAWIEPLLGRLTWKESAVAILGNHDYRHDVNVIRTELRKLGMLVPENSWHEVVVRGEKLMVIGHEGPWLWGRPDLTNCPVELFRLCLSHTPDHMNWAKRNSIDLVLAGHVHGGQIRLPPFGSILLPSTCGRRYDCGVFEEGGTLLHVSRGLSGEHPVRYNCRPEVTLITLRRNLLVEHATSPAALLEQ
jgi:predicted MPP superfamily phosphohydrolase